MFFPTGLKVHIQYLLHAIVYRENRCVVTMQNNEFSISAELWTGSNFGLTNLLRAPYLLR